MKKILSTVMLVLVVVACFTITATATKQKGVQHKHDLWNYTTSICTGSYKSTYYDCTSYSYCSPTAWALPAGNTTHATKVTNNQYGTTSGWCYARCTRAATATVKANWFGKNGTASISCWLD